MARAADPEDSMRKLATGLCAGLLFTSEGGPDAASESSCVLILGFLTQRYAAGCALMDVDDGLLIKS